MPTRTAYAKVNLFLHVLAREASGYHGIETLFCRIDLADVVTAERGSAGISLDIDGSVPGDIRDNLVWRAADSFYRAIARDPAVSIKLVKRIPAGAGLGGGSSDAAATLHALNDLHGNPVGDEDLVEIGGNLGSDVAFFVTGADLALAWGRGQRLLELPALPARPVLVAVPAQPMATAEAYAMLAGLRGDQPPAAGRAIDSGRLTSWNSTAQLAHNDFEAVVLPHVDGLARIRDVLRDSGARISLLSGSGSALFGVFDDTADRDRARRRLEAAFSGLHLHETATVRA